MTIPKTNKVFINFCKDLKRLLNIWIQFPRMMMCRDVSQVYLSFDILIICKNKFLWIWCWFNLVNGRARQGLIFKGPEDMFPYSQRRTNRHSSFQISLKITKKCKSIIRSTLMTGKGEETKHNWFYIVVYT